MLRPSDFAAGFGELIMTMMMMLTVGRIIITAGPTSQTPVTPCPPRRLAGGTQFVTGMELKQLYAELLMLIMLIALTATTAVTAGYLYCNLQQLIFECDV